MRLLSKPLLVLLKDFIAVAVLAENERVAPLGRATDIDVVGLLFAMNDWHHLPGSLSISRAVSMSKLSHFEQCPSVQVS